MLTFQRGVLLGNSFMGYLHNLLVEARRLAKTDEREFLVYLIEMAIIECGAGEPDRERERTTTKTDCAAG
ncbi:hypothetical protein ACO34A_03815 [Rhizobium sp. ACO-34A]|nr:hypothetical protein ACO34A_03815 [Rhizobium sp. ACO-34A]